MPGCLLFSYVKNTLSNVTLTSNLFKYFFDFRTNPIENVDLNNIQTVGVYNSNKPVAQGNITNAPVTQAFKLIVLNQGDENYIRQLVLPSYSNEIYTRYRYYYNGWTWLDWQKFSLSSLK